MIPASFPRSQASSFSANSAKREPTRFLCVGGNGIKLYSNLRPHASHPMRSAGKLLLRPLGWLKHPLPEASRNCQKSCLEIAAVEIASYGNSFTLTAVCNARRLLCGFSLRYPRCTESRSIRRKFENNRAICRHRERTCARWSAPTAGSQGKHDHTPNALP